MRHLWDKYLIPHEYTNRVWNHLERANPDLFILYYARIRERNPQPEICQRILDALDQIQSNTEQIVKLLTDVHEFGRHPSAAVSLKRQRTEKAEERGKSEESEKKQKKEKLQEKKEDGEGEILQDQNLQPQQ
ncbi:BnaA02g25230D [Brassica napus]|nr:BnaA02g25230D [Brassica napus]